MKETGVTALLAGILAAILSIFGGWSAAMTTLVVLIGLDIISGFIRAYVQQTLSSKESYRGIGRKLLIMIAVALAAQLDNLMGDASLLRDAVVVFYCASEGLSIVENLVAAGLPVPDQLKAALAQLNGKKFEGGAKC